MESSELRGGRSARARGPLRWLALIAGIALALYLGNRAPRDQHVRIVLGEAAATVQALDLTYENEQGEALREAHLAFGGAGATPAPRVVSHDPSLPDGAYRLRIDVETREGRRTVERRVTLGGGSTQIDVSATLHEPGPLGSTDAGEDRPRP